MLRVDDVTVRFDGRTVLDAVSLEVATGEVVALLGPSGSGKSTLLRVIAGLETPDTGTVRLDDVDLTGVPPHRRHIGLVFQDNQLFPHRDVAANIGFGLRMRGADRATRTARVREMLALVDLQGFEHRSVTTLSGGEAKRVALARALAPSPAVLLLDEPLTGLDAELHDRLLVDLRDVLRATQITAVLVTHDRDEAAALARRVLQLADLGGGPRPWKVEQIPAEATHDLRRRVLRDGTPNQEVVFPEDAVADTIHLAVRDGGIVVGVSTWAPTEWSRAPGKRAVRLRGMAVDPGYRGRGVGAALVRAGLDRARVAGAEVVWAAARDSALAFYTLLGFEVVGAGYVDSGTALAHHDIWIAP